MRFQGKRMIQIQENGEKSHFGHDLGPLDPNSDHHFFFKNLDSSITRYHGQLLSCKISEKTNDPILRKFIDGRTDGRTDDSDFIERCPTDVKRSISKLLKTPYGFLMFS